VTVVTKSIGTVARDYSTITAWEADLDNVAVYSAADDAVGECYKDSVFDESVTIDGGGTVGLTSVKLTVAAGERHDGTAGNGARIVRTASSNFVINLARTNLIVEWLEVDMNGNAINLTDRGVFTVSSSEAGNPTTSVNNVIVHDASGSYAGGAGVANTTGGRSIQVLNSIFYDLNTNQGTGASGMGVYSRDNLDILDNLTVHYISRTDGTSTGEIYGILNEVSGATIKNSIVTDTTDLAGTLLDTKDFKYTTPTATNNLSSDASADDAGGAGHLINKTSANQFVSTAGGSEDLHLKAGADAIDAGTDLGTTPTGVNFDIDNRDRDAEGDVWDMGADEYVAALAFFPYHVRANQGLIGR